MKLAALLREKGIYRKTEDLEIIRDEHGVGIRDRFPAIGRDTEIRRVLQRTFQENADLKAAHAARATFMYAIADDSGLEIDELEEILVRRDENDFIAFGRGLERRDILVDDLVDRLRGSAVGVSQRPAGESLGYRVQVIDSAAGVGSESRQPSRSAIRCARTRLVPASA